MATMNGNELPRGWVRTSIEQVLVALESGGRPKGGAKGIKEGVPSIGGEHLSYGNKFDFTNVRFVPRTFYETMTRGKIKRGDVLVVKDGATTGKTSFVSESFPYAEAAVNEHVFILRVADEILAGKYLSFWMQSRSGQECVEDNFQGTAQGGINTSFVRNSVFPLPPLPEQHRIVAKIEELFTRLDAGVKALHAIKVQLKRYRQSVLKSAFEGKLTAEWRKAHKHELDPAGKLLERIRAERKEKLGKKFKEPSPIDTSGLPELSAGWVWAKIGQLGRVQLGRQRAPKHHTGKHMRPYLRVANVFEDQINTDDILEMNFTPDEYETFRLEYGDILLNEGQSPEFLGRPAMYRNEVPGACFQNTLIRFRACRGLMPDYALIVFRGYLHTGRFRKTSQITTNLAHMSAGRFSEIEFPLPPFDEQREIVNEIERCFSVADAIKKIVDQSVAQSHRLRQSVLKRAFEGKLVPQDPNDPPASELLERIRSERQKATRESEESNKKRTTVGR